MRQQSNKWNLQQLLIYFKIPAACSQFGEKCIQEYWLYNSVWTELIGYLLGSMQYTLIEYVEVSMLIYNFAYSLKERQLDIPRQQIILYFLLTRATEMPVSLFLAIFWMLVKVTPLHYVLSIP